MAEIKNYRVSVKSDKVNIPLTEIFNRLIERYNLNIDNYDFSEYDILLDIEAEVISDIDTEMDYFNIYFAVEDEKAIAFIEDVSFRVCVGGQIKKYTYVY